MSVIISELHIQAKEMMEKALYHRRKRPDDFPFWVDTAFYAGAECVFQEIMDLTEEWGRSDQTDTLRTYMADVNYKLNEAMAMARKFHER